MINGKVTGIIAGAGFLFSLFIGILSGNLFWTIILRSFFSGIFCGAFGAGLQFVVKKYLPELLSPEAVPSTARGNGVDIVLPEEHPHSENVEEEPAGQLEEVSGEVASEPESIPVVEPAEAAGTGPEEAAPAEEAEELPAAEEPEVAQEAYRGSGDLDSLPDIDSLKGAPVSPHANGSPRSNGERARLLASEEDPAALARAVRTFMKKDSRG